MKVYGVGYEDGDSNGLAVWEGDKLYTTQDRAKEVFAEWVKKYADGWEISEDGMTAQRGGWEAGVIEFEMED